MWSHLYRLTTGNDGGVGLHKDSAIRLLSTRDMVKALDIVRVNTEIDVVLKTTVSSSHDDGVIIQVQNKVFGLTQKF